MEREDISIIARIHSYGNIYKVRIDDVIGNTGNYTFEVFY
jgi:hypothetical protein